MGQVRVSATCIILSPMGHVNDGGESRLRRGFATGAAAAFGGGGVGRCVGGDLLWRAERVRAMVRRDVCAQHSSKRRERTPDARKLVSKKRLVGRARLAVFGHVHLATGP